MFQCLPQRDGSYSILAACREGYYDNAITQKAYTTPTLFAIVRSRVKCLKQRSFKYLPSVAKVKAVFTNALVILVLGPFKIHIRSLIGRELSSNQVGAGRPVVHMKAPLRPAPVEY